MNVSPHENMRHICKALERQIGEKPKRLYITPKDWKAFGFKPTDFKVDDLEMIVTTQYEHSIFSFPTQGTVHVEFTD